eukprot:g13859.t1
MEQCEQPISLIIAAAHTFLDQNGLAQRIDCMPGPAPVHQIRAAAPIQDGPPPPPSSPSSGPHDLEIDTDSSNEEATLDGIMQRLDTMHRQIEQCSDNVRHAEEWIRTCFQPLEVAVRENERRVDVAITAFREGVPSLRSAHLRVAEQVQGSANVVTQVRIEMGDLLELCQTAKDSCIAGLFEKMELFGSDFTEGIDDSDVVQEKARELINTVSQTFLDQVIKDPNKFYTRKQKLAHSQACMAYLEKSPRFAVGPKSTESQKAASVQFVTDFAAFATYMSTMAKERGEMLLSKSPSGTDNITMVKQGDDELARFCHIVSELFRLYQCRVISKQQNKQWPLLLLVLISSSWSYRLPRMYSLAINYMRALIIMSYDPRDLEEREAMRLVARKDPIHNHLIRSIHAEYGMHKGGDPQGRRDMARNIMWPLKTLHGCYKHNSRHYDVLTQAFHQVTGEVETRQGQSKDSNATTIDPAAEEGDFILREEDIRPDAPISIGSSGWLLAKGKGKRCGNAVIIQPGKGSIAVRPGLAREPGDPLAAVSAEMFTGFMPQDGGQAKQGEPLPPGKTRFEQTGEFQFINGNTTTMMKLDGNGGCYPLHAPIPISTPGGASSSLSAINNAYVQGGRNVSYTQPTLGGMRRTINGSPVLTGEAAKPLPDPLAELEARRVPISMRRQVVGPPTAGFANEDTELYIDIGYAIEFERGASDADAVPDHLWKAVAFTHQDEVSARMYRVVMYHVRVIMGAKKRDFEGGVHDTHDENIHPMLYALNLRSTIAV